MKRHNWLTLGLGLSLVIAACDDDNKKGMPGDVGDGGVDGGGDLSDQLRNLQNDINKLGMDQTGLDGRLDVLEMPKDPKSCSAGELCIPDGVNLSREGLKPIITELCARETTCCSAGELNWLYGPAIKSAADCEASFNDLVNNGIRESNEMFSPYLDEVVMIAHALNNTDVHISINTDAVTACAASIKAKACPGAGEAVKGPASCKPNIDAQDPCSLESLVKGLEREGDTCDPETEITECGDGLVCRRDLGTGAQPGLCAAKAAVGDRCTDDEDCDDLFCDFAAGKCAARAKEGEACVYVDPTFQYVRPDIRYTWLTTGVNEWIRPLIGYANSQVTKLDCETELSCDPLTNTCTKIYCDTGSYCFANSDCPTGTACLHGQNDAMKALQGQGGNYANIGVCGATVADSGVCHVFGAENDCASKRCSGTCLPPLAADGATCAVPGDCASGHCGTDLKCSPACDMNCTGSDCRSCGAGTYCAPTNASVGFCEPQIANGLTCNTSSYVFDAHYNNKSCTSGYCNGSNQCTAKVGPGGTCTANQHAACPDGQFCKGTTCTAQPAIGDTCAAADACGPTDTRVCWDVDGALSGTVKRCYEGNGTPKNLPAGVYCGSDGQCEKGWCRNSGNTLCKEPVADGAACTVAGATPDHCGADSYCATVVNTDAGTCKKRGAAGDTCEPRFEGNDCVGGSCTLQHESFLCDLNSLPEDKVFCHADQLL
ncbi:MAG: hypothetical protein QM778_20220 [Myxococcales bacterium]